MGWFFKGASVDERPYIISPPNERFSTEFHVKEVTKYKNIVFRNLYIMLRHISSGKGFVETLLLVNFCCDPYPDLMNLAMFPCIIEVFFFETNSACFWVLFWGSFQLTTVDSIWFENPAPPAELKLRSCGSVPIEINFFRRDHGGHENQKMAGLKPNRKHREFPSRILLIFGWVATKIFPKNKRYVWGRYRMTYSSPPDLFFQWSFLINFAPPFWCCFSPSPTLVTFAPVEMEPRRFLIVEAEKTNKNNWIHPWKLTCPKKRDYFNRKYIFQFQGIC